MTKYFVINTEAAIFQDGKWLVGVRSKKKKARLRDSCHSLGVETPSLSIQSNGAGIRMSGGASISIGYGASISVGGRRIFGGQIISANLEQVLGDPGLEVKKETRVDFQFDGGISAIGLLKQVAKKCQK